MTDNFYTGQSKDRCLTNTPKKRKLLAVKLRKITKSILDFMQEHGWYLKAERQIRYTRPLPWDINCGDCENWAIDAKFSLKFGEVIWLDELNSKYGIDESTSCAHAVFMVGDWLFDSQHPEGVLYPGQLSIVRGISREDKA